MGTLSFQMSQPIRSSKDISVSIDTMQCFLAKIGERYSFMQKPESQQESTTSAETSVNEVMEAVVVDEDNPLTQDLVCSITDEDGLMELFDQFSGLMSPVSD